MGGQVRDPPAKNIRSSNVGSMLVHRQRRWTNIDPTWQSDKCDTHQPV